MKRSERTREDTIEDDDRELFAISSGTFRGESSLADEGRPAVGSRFRTGEFLPVWVPFIGWQPTFNGSGVLPASRFNGQWYATVPNAETLLHRLDEDGEPRWVARWGFPTIRSNFLDTRNTIKDVATDGTKLFAAGTRCSHIAGNWRHAWSVAAYNDYGHQLWTYDLGDDATCMVLASGQLVVGHAATWNVAEPITLSMIVSSSVRNLSIIDPLFTYQTTSTTPVSQFVDFLNRILGLDGRITVTGSSWNAGVTLTYDSTLAGPHGRRKFPTISADALAAVPSAANFTMLNPATGAAVQHRFVGQADDGLFRIPPTPSAMANLLGDLSPLTTMPNTPETIAALGVGWPNGGLPFSSYANPLTGQTYASDYTLNTYVLHPYGLNFYPHTWPLSIPTSVLTATNNFVVKSNGDLIAAGAYSAELHPVRAYALVSGSGFSAVYQESWDYAGDAGVRVNNQSLAGNAVCEMPDGGTFVGCQQLGRIYRDGIHAAALPGKVDCFAAAQREE